MKSRLFLPLVMLMMIAACNHKKNDAAKAYKAALADTSKSLGAMMAVYPTKLAELDKLEASDPAKGAQLIKAELLPPLDHVIDTMRKAGDAGKKYVDLAGDEDQKVIAGIRKNIATNEKQVEGYAQLRQLLADEEALLEKGPLSEQDETRIAQAMVTAMASVAKPN